MLEVQLCLMKIGLTLLKKYDVPVPRYTSYPTVPFWNDEIDIDQWKQTFREQFSEHNHQEGISVYIHLPFCESLCTYCGCNKKITTNHSVELEYLDAIIKEWKLYRQLMGEPPIIRELHLGGGTPTFFSPRNLGALLEAIIKRSIVHPHHEFSVEGHPNNTTPKHLETLYNFGFRRISLGVQDNDQDVQQIINRVQPFENVQQVTAEARRVGFKSVNFDLIYGLPLQTVRSMERTILQCITLRPDRVAFYSYAHVPWTSRGQRLFDETDLPSTALKMQLYLLGKQLFTANGYSDIGMDHFALPGDDLYKAWNDGWLHRNFMGYTTQRSGMLLGLGVSSISETGVGFAQNEKALHNYYQLINNNQLALTKGYFMSDEDVAFREYILNISCMGYTALNAQHLPTLRKFTFHELEKLASDSLVEWSEQEVRVTPLGRNFIRNICKAFDLHLLRSEKESESLLFSKAI
jgi:oxygen-independent coproporphyrinogen-3 oxidase